MTPWAEIHPSRRFAAVETIRALLGDDYASALPRLPRPHQISYTPGDDTTRNPARFDCTCGQWWADDAPHGWDHSIIDHLYEGER